MAFTESLQLHLDRESIHCLLALVFGLFPPWIASVGKEWAVLQGIDMDLLYFIRGFHVEMIVRSTFRYFVFCLGCVSLLSLYCQSRTFPIRAL